MALKLDMVKAYDCVEWSFLKAMMCKLGFQEVFCNWVMECVMTVTYSVMINGEATKFISPSRGLRQGDPLSPFLFLICAKGFSSLIQREEREGRLWGLKVATNVDPVSHVFFADDSMLFCRATGFWSVHKFGEEFSDFSSNCTENIKTQLAAVMCIRHQEGFGKYLGIQADFGASKVKVFEDIRNIVDDRINGWAEQFLSLARKEVLIKSVASTLSNYAMSCFQLPIQLAKEIEQVIARFWWMDQETKKGVHWMAWDKVSNGKAKGGLGFKESLLAKLLRAKYFSNSSFMDAPTGRGTSWGWKGILQSRRILKAGIRCRVGDVRNIRIRSDPWLPTPRTFLPLSRHEEMPEKVVDLLEEGGGIWKIDITDRCFNIEEARCIKSIPLSKFGYTDKLFWHYTKSGVYLVKSGYLIAQDLNRNGELGCKGVGESSVGQDKNKVWATIWRLDVPLKLRHFLWRCYKNILAVRGVVSFSDNMPNLWCAQVFWFGTPIQLDSNLVGGDDFMNCWQWLCKRYKSEEDVESIMRWLVCGPWKLWKCRNNLVFENQLVEPMKALRLVQQQWLELDEIQKENVMRWNETHQPAKRAEDFPTSWVKTPFCKIKVNCDGAWVKQTGRGGHGWIARDFAGIFKGAGGLGNILCESSLMAEAEAIQAALMACVEKGFSLVQLETNSKSLVEMLNETTISNGVIGGILFDIQCIKQQQRSVEFIFAPRDCNRAMHLVTSFVSRVGGLLVGIALNQSGCLILWLPM